MIVSQNVVSEDDIILNEILSDKDIPGEVPFKAYIEVTVYDKDGNVTQHHRQPMRSLTQYFLGFMAIDLIATYQNASTNQAPPLIVNALGLPSQINSSGCGVYPTWSIQLGSGTQSFSPTLNSLAAPIANGSGAGELEYGTTYISYTQTSIIVYITVFNPSVSTISVSEIGLSAALLITNGGSYNQTYNFLLSYDTFSTPIAISGNAYATFQITLTFSG